MNRSYEVFDMFFLLIFLISSISCFAEDAQSAFTEIYEKGVWGGKDFSGTGSQIEYTRGYIKFIEDFMKENKIETVVDLGCGDWQFSRYVNWDNVEYLGIDVVPHMVEKANQQFAKKNIKFLHADAIHDELPPADLLLCKEVLQHLPNKDILKILGQLHKYKYCIITNDVDYPSCSSANLDIPMAQYRTIDLAKPPFNLMGCPVMHYYGEHELKQVFLVINP